VFPEPELDPPQPIKPVRQKLNAVVKTAKTESRLITFPLS